MTSLHRLLFSSASVRFHWLRVVVRGNRHNRRHWCMFRPRSTYTWDAEQRENGRCGICCRIYTCLAKNGYRQGVVVLSTIGLHCRLPLLRYELFLPIVAPSFHNSNQRLHGAWNNPRGHPSTHPTVSNLMVDPTPDPQDLPSATPVQTWPQSRSCALLP